MTSLIERLRAVDASWSDVGETCAEAADEIERLTDELADRTHERDQRKNTLSQRTAELASARPADIHSCHDQCMRAGCVNARLRQYHAAELADMRAERDKALADRDALQERLDARRAVDEMDAVAIKYAHRMALDLECILAEYGGSWYVTAMETLGAYRMAMSAIHERESPTHMGEPVVARKAAP